MAETNYCYFDIFIDSEEDVLLIRKKALELMRGGVKVMHWSGEGTESTKEFVAPVLEVLQETRQFLKTLNPGRYGYMTNSARMIRY